MSTNRGIFITGDQMASDLKWLVGWSWVVFFVICVRATVAALADLWLRHQWVWGGIEAAMALVIFSAFLDAVRRGAKYRGEA